MLVKTTGGGTPARIFTYECSLASCGFPDWSPVGDRITSWNNDSEWILISPDGKSTSKLGKIDNPYLVFSKDGKLLYGILNSHPKIGQAAAILFSLDPATLKRTTVKDLGTDAQPAARVYPGIRFSMAPDGKSFLYSTGESRQDIWMLQGFKQPSWLDRFSLH